MSYGYVCNPCLQASSLDHEVLTIGTIAIPNPAPCDVCGTGFLVRGHLSMVHSTSVQFLLAERATGCTQPPQSGTLEA